MEQPAINEHLVRKYLLGQLPERERERLEVGLLRDDQYYESLAALEDEVEDELIDQYLDGELTEPEREHFERVFLKVPERAHKLKVIKDLKERAPVRTPEPVRSDARAKSFTTPRSNAPWNPLVAIFQNPMVGFSMAAALLVAMLCCLWLVINSNRLQEQLRYAQSQGQADPVLKEQLEQLRKSNEELTAQLRTSEERLANLEQQQKDRQNQSPNPTFASVILSPSLRGSGGQSVSTLNLTSGATRARLTLNVQDVDPKDYKRFRALVKKTSGAEVWRSENVKLQGRGTGARTTLTLPIERITAGEYTVDLEGVTPDNQSEPLGLYFFRAVAK